jgi:non-homologous end joining protein Ku
MENNNENLLSIKRKCEKELSKDDISTGSEYKKSKYIYKKDSFEDKLINNAKEKNEIFVIE